MGPSRAASAPAGAMEDYEAELVDSLSVPPSPSGFVPPPPFEHTEGQGQFRAIKWAGNEGKKEIEEDDDLWEARKGPLVEHLATGLDKMREAAAGVGGAGTQSYSSSSLLIVGNEGRRSQSFTGSLGTPGSEKGKMMMGGAGAGEYYEDYDEIDPKSEGLKDEEGFRRAGAEGFAGGVRVGEHRGVVGLGMGDGGGGAAAAGQQKVGKKRGLIWERLKGGGK